VGIAIALVSGRVIASMLYGISPHDPTALGVMATIMLFAAFAASLVPAWRAGAVDPVVAMRAN